MKIISLNASGGRHQGLIAFIQKEAATTDVFCFQEMLHSHEHEVINDAHTDLFSTIAKAIPDFIGFFAPAIDNTVYDVTPRSPTSFGLAMFVRKSLHINAHGDFFVYGERNWTLSEERNHPRNVEYVSLMHNKKELYILNVHGVYRKFGKSDCPERMTQSELITDFIKTKNAETVLCGDFNLNPDTESIAILEKHMRSLIKDFGITSTRSPVYTKPNKYADYIFVTRDIQVKKFHLPEVTVSDHLPLILEI